MGYRSDGGIVIYGPEPQMLAHLMAMRMTQTDPTPWRGNLDELRIYRNNADLVWHLEYSGWKWYEGYSYVQEFERIYAEAARNPNLSGYTWRFGEDDDDTTADYFGEADTEAGPKERLDLDFPDGAVYRPIPPTGTAQLAAMVSIDEVHSVADFYQIHERLVAELPLGVGQFVHMYANIITLRMEDVSAEECDVLENQIDTICSDFGAVAGIGIQDNTGVRVHGPTWCHEAEIGIFRSFNPPHHYMYHNPDYFPDVR